MNLNQRRRKNQTLFLPEQVSLSLSLSPPLPLPLSLSPPPPPLSLSLSLSLVHIQISIGGAYIPPAKLRMMQAQVQDKNSVAYQRIAWEALKKSINGLINKVRDDTLCFACVNVCSPPLFLPPFSSVGECVKHWEHCPGTLPGEYRPWTVNIYMDVSLTYALHSAFSPPSLPPSLPPSFPPSLPLSLPPSSSPSFLPLSLPASSPSLPPFLPPSLSVVYLSVQ